MKMPAIFVGHGSPMNAIESNSYTDQWRLIGEKYKPKGIVVISAHWYTSGNKTQDDLEANKINDIYGFPRGLYELAYPARGNREMTQAITESLGKEVIIDNSWGIDHGTWSVLLHMYPNADIPVVQLSVDRDKRPEEQVQVGKKIAGLRNQGYMILGSGNVVHNLRMINPDLSDGSQWAQRFDDYIENAIRSSNYEACIDYSKLGDASQYSVPTPEHYYPLLNVLGAVSKEDVVTVFNKAYEMGSLSMTSYLFDE